MAARTDDCAHDTRLNRPPVTGDGRCCVDQQPERPSRAQVAVGCHFAPRRASTRGARLFGLSRLKDRASPNWVFTNSSISATAFRKSLFLGMKLAQTIDSVNVSNSHIPTRRPRSKMA